MRYGQKITEYPVCDPHEPSPKSTADLQYESANSGLFFVSFAPFHSNIKYKNLKSIDGVHGIRTRGNRMLGTDETMVLWRSSNMQSYDNKSN